MELSKDFVFTGVPVSTAPKPLVATNPLGPLALLPGTWTGTGFNQIWRPFHGSQDRFLELNRTIETIQFEEIPGDIPNRGFLQADIALHGITYLQQIQDANVKGPNGKPAGIHIEPGIWVTVPATQNPNDPSTVARLANIPHGTSLVAQGTAQTITHAPTFPPANITPFPIRVPPSTLPPPPSTLIHFPESNLSTPSNFRTPPADLVGITQAMIDNPNSVLAAGIAGKNIIQTTILQVSTILRAPPAPTSGGGTGNIAFLAGTTGGPNAVTAQVDATFWIETIKAPNGTLSHQLQYSQSVLLNFNTLSWPHVTVATLLKH